MLKPRTLSLMAATLLALTTAPSFAKGNAGGGGMGDHSSAHTSQQSLDNGNGKYATDRDKGRARAGDRMSDQGADNSHGGNMHGKMKGKHK